MSIGSDQVWVTFVENDELLVSALILAKSIRRTFSHRKILALHGPKLSLQARKILSSEYDGLVKMEKETTKVDCDWETYAKIYCLSLPLFKKCVFLSSTSIMLENCDDLFDLKGDGANFGNSLRPSVLVLSASMNEYFNIMETIQKSNDNAKEVFEAYLKAKDNFKYIDASFDSKIISSSNELKKVVNAINVVNNKITDDISGLGASDKMLSEMEKKLLADVFQELQNPKDKVEYPSKAEPIAIVGMSCRLPGANTLDEFWELMMGQVDAIRTLPEDRWTTEQSYVIDDELREMQAGWLKCPIDEFDGNFFGISPAELSYTDPQQRLLLEVIWEALEDSAIDPLSLQGTTTGVFTGQWIFDYKEHLIESGFKGREMFRSYMGNGYGTTASRPSHFLGITGPNISTESGCSSSMVAVGLAMKSLRNGDTNLAIAAGVNLLLLPYYYDSLKHLISRDGHSKTFDASADGFARAEGCGVLILKRLSDAVKDGDRIYALIRGFGQSQEGLSKSMGTPTVECEAAAMRIALQDSGTDPLDISYVETHGTGTPVGDPMEVKAIEKVYSANRTEPLIIASVKTNVGHTESCSGITGMIKTVLSLFKEEIPPHRSLITLNPKINLETIPAIIPLKPLPWKKQANKRRMAGVSSFGISGTDAHVILEESPQQIQNDLQKSVTSTSESKLSVLTLSAKCEPALDELLRRYGKLLTTAPSGDFSSIAYTSAVGRAHLPHRVAILLSNSQDGASAISQQRYVRGICNDNKPKVCFLFTGQGSQFSGMGKTLYEKFPTFKSFFDKCEAFLNSEFGISVKHAIWEDQTGAINHSLYSQASIFVIEYSLTKLWESWGIKPQQILGHSLGEFAAAAAAGILSFTDALTLVGTRAKLIDSLPRGKMIVVKGNERATKHLISIFNSANPNMWLDFAAMNTSTQTTLAGTTEAITAFQKFCKNIDTKTHILEATHAFHSRMMDTILEEFKKTALKLTYNKPTCEYISGMDGRLIESLDADYFVRHTREAVSFQKASVEAYKSGTQVFLEVGPQPVLCALISQNIEEESTEEVYCIPSMKKTGNEEIVCMDALIQLYMRGQEVDWHGFYKNHEKTKVTLPLYPFQRSKYWFNPESQDHWIPRSEKRQLHPLVGHLLESPTNIKMFKGFISTKKYPEFVDHKIGSHVIFPASGFIEVALAAGFASFLSIDEKFQRPEIPISIMNLQIKSPLQMIENKTYEFQTIVVKGKLNSESFVAEVKTHSRLRGAGKSDTKNWTLHSESQFKFGSSYPLKNQHQLQGVSQSKSKLQPFSMDEFYPQLNSLGYNFGTYFKSLENVWKKDGEVLAEVTEIKGEFLCHPVTMDSMIQAALISTFDVMSDLQLPIFVEHFISFPAASAGTGRYIYVPKERDSEGKLSVFLLNEHEEIVALMIGLELAKTTLIAFNAALQSKAAPPIPMFVENWQKSNNSVDFNKNETFNLEVMESNGHFKVTDPLEKELESLNKTIPLGIIQAFTKLGLQTSPGTTIDIKTFMANSKATKESQKFITRAFEILIEDGYLDSNFVIKNPFPDARSIQKELESKIKSTGILQAEWELAQKFINKLSEIITGVTNYESIFSADRFYRDSGIQKKLKTSLVSQFEKYVNILAKNANQKSRTIRILEICNGYEGPTNEIIEILTKNNVSFVYELTEKTTVLLSLAKQRAQSHNEVIQYNVLNLEEDPKTQGFVPHKYDFILTTSVLNGSKNPSQTVSNIRHLLKPLGLFIFAENFSKQRHLDISFGHSEEYWGNNHSALKALEWKKLLQTLDFQGTKAFDIIGVYAGIVVAEASNDYPKYNRVTVSTSKGKTWIVFSQDDTLSNGVVNRLELADRPVIQIKAAPKFNQNGKTEFQVEPTNKSDILKVFKQIQSTNDKEIEGILYLWSYPKIGSKFNKDTPILTQSYLYLLQSLLECEFSPSPRIYTVTQGQVYIGDQEALRPHSSPLIGISKVFQNENGSFISKCIDLNPEENQTETTMGIHQILSEIWNGDYENLIAYRDEIRHVPRLHSLDSGGGKTFTPLHFPNSNRYCLTLPTSKLISDLKFGFLLKQTVGSKDVEIEIKAAGLNFKDVLSVLKPTPEFNNQNSVGADFAGIVTEVGSDVTKFKVGDAVMGCNLQGNALPSFTTMAEDQLIPLPNKFTFAEGATIPVAFITAYHCLVNVAKLTKGENVLIHTASGGVGLVAVQIARLVGANVFATAGSKRKRSYLRSIGIQHIYNSRDVSYEKQIMVDTNNIGVHVVLNSITGPGFKEASLNCCTNNARFIEMSKLNIWSTSQVKTLRPDVFYSIEDLALPIPTRIRDLMAELDRLLQSGSIKPIAYTSFEAARIHEALSFLEKAKQVGKVVVRMPEVQTNNEQAEFSSPLFNDRSSYLVTGGLKGIGLQVGKWMVQNGARYLVLCSRSPPNEEATNLIEQLRAANVTVKIINSDIGDFETCRRLLNSIKDVKEQLPPLRGIMHSAGCLSDAAISNQTWEKFQITMNPKVVGGWNLHSLTANNEYNLEHFVVFSSMVALLGSPGQSNHCASNTFLDSLTHFRNSCGLPATSVNWGQWGETGVAAGKVIAGVTPFSTTQGLNALENVLKSNAKQVAVCAGDVTAWVKNINQATAYFEKLESVTTGVEANSEQFLVTCEDFFANLAKAVDKDEKLEIIRINVCKILAKILCLESVEKIKKAQEFQDMGMDSLMMIEFRNQIQKILGSNAILTANEMADCNTLELLANKLHELIYHKK